MDIVEDEEKSKVFRREDWTYLVHKHRNSLKGPNDAPYITETIK